MFTIRTYGEDISTCSDDEGNGRMKGSDVLAAIMGDGMDYLDLGQQAAAYEALFWQPLMGAAYSFYVTVRGFAQAVDAWPEVSVDMLARSMGQGDRTAILGRAAGNGRPALPGAAQLLDELDVVIHRSRRRGTRSTHTFEVLMRLPVLTPAQVAGFERPLADAHDWFLGSIPGYNVIAWRELDKASFVPEAAAKFGRVRVGKP
jgi:hypothetical protein